jgi:tetratricopeptide (TPR) repeat protein
MTLQSLYEEALGSHRRGDLAAAESLYRRLLAAAPKSFAARHMLGVLRAQQGALPEALELLEAALVQKPDAHDARFNYGNALRKAGRVEEALAAFDQALEQKPDYAAARAARAELLNLRGNALRDAGNFAAALACFERALADAPNYPDALNNRAVALWSMNRFEEAVAGFDAALAVRPDYAQAHYNRGNALRDLQRLDDAMASYDRGIALDPDFAQAHSNKGFCLLLKGDFAQGLPLYEWRKRMAAPVESRNFDRPLWTGHQDIQGKTIFVHVGQGLGDTIQFFRFVAPLLERGAKVILSVQDGLLRLLQSASPPVTLVGSTVVPESFDYHVPLMSLPLALGITIDSIPSAQSYLRAEPARVARWRDRIGDRAFRIGIAWQGARIGIAGRAIPLACFEDLSRLENVRLISLQKGPGTEQLAALPGVETLGEDFDAGPEAFLDSAAVMDCLDLVITLDSALAHLAGALGRPVWVALKQVPDWRWFLDRSDSPWYPSMRLFRQKTEGDWSSVFAAMESQVRR